MTDSISVHSSDVGNDHNANKETERSGKRSVDDLLAFLLYCLHFCVF